MYLLNSHLKHHWENGCDCSDRCRVQGVRTSHNVDDQNTYGQTRQSRTGQTSELPFCTLSGQLRSILVVIDSVFILLEYSSAMGIIGL